MEYGGGLEKRGRRAFNTCQGSDQYLGRSRPIPRYGRINKAVSTLPSTGSLEFFDWPFSVRVQTLLMSRSGPFCPAAALVHFAALYGIIITDIGEGGNTLAAADLESA